MIRYHTQDVTMPAIDPQRISQWIDAVAASHGRRLGEVNYIFMDDPGILAVNRQFLGHDYYTDIITFDYTEGDILSGDLFISIDSVRENARIYGATFEDELDRVMVHGVLHLLGYDDHTDEQTAVMREKENYYVNMKRSLQK